MLSHRWIVGLVALALLFAGCRKDPPKPPMTEKEIEDNTELNIDTGVDATPGEVLPGDNQDNQDNKDDNKDDSSKGEKKGESPETPPAGSDTDTNTTG